MEDNLKNGRIPKMKMLQNKDQQKKDYPKNKDSLKNWEDPKNEDSPKNKENRRIDSTSELKKAQKWRLTLTAAAPATFPLDHCWKNELQNQK